jgi:hypothetical protein
MGEQSLKNIARPVRAYAVKLGAAASVPAAPRKARSETIVWFALAAAVVVVLIVRECQESCARGRVSIKF